MSEEGSDGSPVRSKRKIKKVVLMSSASDSDSDNSVGVAGTRRKRLRVISDDDASSSSGSSVVCGGVRRRRTLPKLRDSEEESDTSGWATDHSDTAKSAPAAPAANSISGFASDSSEGNSDKCSICLLRFTNQEVGTPQSCEHIFCLDCIMEWSKNVNTCPVDRMTFDFIVVRACAGGRVLRKEPVKVVERRPSVDILVLEDATVCEVCGSTDNEETMLLCDGCDLGYHMQCLTPPLTEVPLNQWLCPNCDDLLDVIHLSEVDDLYSGIEDLELPDGPRPTALRQPRNLRRSSRYQNAADEPSTSNGRRTNTNLNNVPTTSNGSRTSRRSITRPNRRTTGTQRRRHKPRRTKTVIIEYEIEDNGKFPVTRRVKRRVKKRRTKKRQPRTAARRSHVRASVRAKLANMKTNQHLEQLLPSTSGNQELSIRRQRAGIASLSLFGSAHQLDYFTDDDDQDVNISNGPTTAVAIRPTSNILSAYRQARRKMVSLPSPPHGTSAPDILSNIMESQTLLHSKNSIVSISVDGSVDIKLQRKKQSILPKKDTASTTSDRLDLTKGEDAAKKAPSYPGQSRGGGWGGGYRGNYHREQNSNNFNRGNNYDNNYGGGYQNRQGNNNFQNNNMRRDDSDPYGNYARRPPQYSHNDDSYFDRSRRQVPNETNRGPNYSQQQQLRQNDQGQGRYSLGTSWQPFPIGTPGPRPENQLLPNRHSFGGFENPLDMRMGQAPPSIGSVNTNSEMFTRSDTAIVDKSQTTNYQPLPEPPLFNFSKMPDVEKSEDERSDSGLVIDTEKYDPTEPTNDDDSCDGDKTVPLPAVPEQSPPPTPAAVQNILAGIDTSTINVPPNILDSAVRQVLKEHKNLIVSPKLQHDVSRNDKSDEDSDGDCPNFSIYSATSVHIANNTNLTVDVAKEVPQDNLEDLVQEDDDISPQEHTLPSETTSAETVTNVTTVEVTTINNRPNYSTFDNTIKKKTEEEYKEKVSKRCPITTNTRNPIKIKLNTPSLIKRQLTLYDEDTSEEAEMEEKTEKSESVSELLPDEKLADNLNASSDKVEESSNEKEAENKEIVDSDKNNESEIPVASPMSDQSITEYNKNETSSIEEDSKMAQNQENGLSTTESIMNTPLPMEPEGKEIDDEKENELVKSDSDKSDNEINSEEDDGSDDELCLNTEPQKESLDKNEGVEKMTESISETEDERSYTPCLDENKSKDTSLETDKEKGIEGLDTEMISEDEGNEMFSENEKAPSEASHTSPVRILPTVVDEEVEVLAKKKETKGEDRDESKKKKKKESKRDGKDKNKSKNKKGEISFKKLSKSGKERNYRERDKDEKSKSKKERRESSETAEEKQKRRKEKRKDLERYDVRTVVTEKRKKLKDPFGRDISPNMRSTSLSPLGDQSPTRIRRSFSRNRRSASKGRTSISRIRRSMSRGRKSLSRNRRSLSRGQKSLSRNRRSLSRIRTSLSRVRRSTSLGRKSPSRGRRSPSRSRLSASRIRLSPIRGRKSPSRGRVSPHRGRRSASSAIVRRPRVSLSPRSATPRISPRRSPRRSPCRSPRRSIERKRRRSISARRRTPPRRRRSGSRGRKRRRSASRSPKPKPTKRRSVRARSDLRRVAARRVKNRRRGKEQTTYRQPLPRAAAASSRGRLVPALGRLAPPVPAHPAPDMSPDPRHLRVVVAAEDKRKRKEKRRRDPDRQRHKRGRDAVGPSKEVFTSGDNILVSVSFKDQEREEQGEKRKRRETKREKRKRKRAAVAPETETAKPVAIIDLERSPFRELTPSPKNVIVLSDSEHGDKEAAPGVAGAAGGEAAGAVPPEPAAGAPPAGPKTPPEPGAPAEPAASPSSPPSPRSPHSPDAYDPFEPTRSPSASPRAPGAAGGAGEAGGAEGGAGAPPEPLAMTLEAAQRTNLSADEVLSRRPLSPMEKVLALLQSTRDVSPEPPPGAESEPAPRVSLPEPRAPPKLFVGKAEPIKSNPVKPMARHEDEPDDSPYSPGSSDFGDLFEPPPGAAKATRRDVFDALFDRPPKQRKNKSSAAKVPVKFNKKKGNKTHVGVKIDEDNLKILDDLPSSAVEMQVKSKFLKKLNRQERVVEEVKLVLKPHYNKKHVTKEEYKDILRRAVPKICHNKTGEINPTKIQALVEAYVKKFRKNTNSG